MKRESPGAITGRLGHAIDFILKSIILNYSDSLFSLKNLTLLVFILKKKVSLMKSLKLYVLVFLVTTPLLLLCHSAPFETNNQKLIHNSKKDSCVKDEKASSPLLKSVAFGSSYAALSSLALSSFSNKNNWFPLLLTSTTIGAATGIFHYQKPDTLQEKPKKKGPRKRGRALIVEGTKAGSIFMIVINLAILLFTTLF